MPCTNLRVREAARQNGFRTWNMQGYPLVLGISLYVLDNFIVIN